MRGRVAPHTHHQHMQIQSGSRHLLLASEVLIINPSSTQALKKHSSHFHYSQVDRGQDVRDFKLGGSVQWCRISRGFYSVDEQPAWSHQDACSMIECKLGLAFWRARRTGKVHFNPHSMTSATCCFHICDVFYQWYLCNQRHKSSDISSVVQTQTV